MPIEGVSNVVRIPRMGKIRLGTKVEKPGKSPYPQAADHFVCPPEVQALFGEKPTELEIMFPVEDAEEFAQQWLRAYSLTQGLVCIGDGVISRRKIDLATGGIAGHETRDWEWQEGLPCDPQECPEYGAKRCRRVMNLQFLLPKVPGLGVWQIDTSSYYSIVNINSMIKLVRNLCGRVSFIPLTLCLGPIQVTPPGMTKKTVYVMHIKQEVKLTDLLRAAQQEPARLLMPEPESDEPPEDLYPDEVIDEEEQPQPDYLAAWTEVMELVKELDPDEQRIKEWWQKAYQLEVVREDFTRHLKYPPQKFGGDMIVAFRDRLKETKDVQLQAARQGSMQF